MLDIYSSELNANSYKTIFMFYLRIVIKGAFTCNKHKSLLLFNH